MRGQIYKIHSDFYYVNTDVGIIECKLRDVLKKQKVSVLVGDYVNLYQYDEKLKQAFISEVCERTNFISRPRVANISQVIIVSSLKEPDLDFEQLDRFIANCEYHKITPILCFNKEDIDNTSYLKDKVCDIYKKLGYNILFTSALQKSGIQELFPVLKHNTSILCGASGVGKSSLINAIFNNNNLKTQPVSDKTKKGVHTTRHCEFIEIEKETFIVDTPGFFNLKFDFLLPQEVQNLFPEFNCKHLKCKFKNCTHINENMCAYNEIVSSMAISRYNNYKKFVLEAKEMYDKSITTSSKVEQKFKKNNNRIMTKISSQKRNLSRKTNKQQIDKIIFTEE